MPAPPTSEVRTPFDQGPTVEKLAYYLNPDQAVQRSQRHSVQVAVNQPHRLAGDGSQEHLGGVEQDADQRPPWTKGSHLRLHHLPVRQQPVETRPPQDSHDGQKQESHGF